MRDDRSLRSRGRGTRVSFPFSSLFCRPSSVVLFIMLNIIIISDEAKNIASLFKAAGFSSDTKNPSRPNSASEPASPRVEGYDIAFLDLDTENWQQRLLDVRHSMPV